jgi:hypothetical protein
MGTRMPALHNFSSKNCIEKGFATNMNVWRRSIVIGGREGKGYMYQTLNIWNISIL